MKVGGRNRRDVKPAVLGLVLGVLALVVLYFVQFDRMKARIHQLGGHGAGGAVEMGRERILASVGDWNKHVVHHGLSAKQLISGDDVSRVLGASRGMAAASASSSVKQPGDTRYPMQAAADVERDNPEFAAALKKYSKDGEIMLALANGIMICKNTSICWWNGGNILESFLEIIDHNKISNHLIGVMDDETERYLQGRPYNSFRVNVPIPASQEKSHPANKVSTIKYTLLKQSLSMGINTLITDMDLVYMQNPFDHMHRDSDIEIQTDGFDDDSYGVIGSVHDPSMGWGGGGLYMKLFTTNVGCMYVRANQRSYTLMGQVAEHLEIHAGWDQQVFNEYLLRPAHADFAHSGVSLRILDYMKFVNSKIFFKSRRSQFLPGASSTAKEPIMVHFNYHPDKHKRMLCIMDRYFKGNVSACDHFPVGSNPV